MKSELKCVCVSKLGALKHYQEIGCFSYLRFVTNTFGNYFTTHYQIYDGLIAVKDGEVYNSIG